MSLDWIHHVDNIIKIGLIIIIILTPRWWASMEVSIWKQCRKSVWFGNTIKSETLMEIVWWKRGRNTELVRDKYSLYWLPRLIFPYGLNISTTSYNKSTPKSFLPLLAIFLHIKFNFGKTNTIQCTMLSPMSIETLEIPQCQNSFLAHFLSKNNYFPREDAKLSKF